MSDATTLSQILFKLSVFLSPEDVREIARQMEEHFPSDLAENMNVGLDMALLAMNYEEPERPRLFMGGGDVGAREERTCLRDCARGRSARRGMAVRMEILQEVYPLRAAALYLRVLLNVLAGLFERDELGSMNDGMMRLLIEGLQRAEAVIEARCVDCPKI